MRIRTNGSDRAHKMKCLYSQFASISRYFGREKRNICINVIILIDETILSHFCLHGKNSFAEESKNLARYILKIILLDHQNYYVKRLSVDDNAAKSVDILAISLSVLNYYDGPKLFSNLYLTKFLHSSAKPFFLCICRLQRKINY